MDRFRCVLIVGLRKVAGFVMLGQRAFMAELRVADFGIGLRSPVDDFLGVAAETQQAEFGIVIGIRYCFREDVASFIFCIGLLLGGVC